MSGGYHKRRASGFFPDKCILELPAGGFWGDPLGVVSSACVRQQRKTGVPRSGSGILGVIFFTMLNHGAGSGVVCLYCLRPLTVEQATGLPTTGILHLR